MVDEKSVKEYGSQNSPSKEGGPRCTYSSKSLRSPGQVARECDSPPLIPLSTSAPFRLSPHSLQARLGERGSVSVVPIRPVVRRSSLRVAADLRPPVVPPAAPTASSSPANNTSRIPALSTGISSPMAIVSGRSLSWSWYSIVSRACPSPSRGGDALDDFGLGVYDDRSRHPVVAEEGSAARGPRPSPVRVCCWGSGEVRRCCGNGALSPGVQEASFVDCRCTAPCGNRRTFLTAPGDAADDGEA